MAKTKLTFNALVASQSPKHKVLIIKANAHEIHKIATIERLGRDNAGHSTGFQRPQIAGHINEIRNYLEMKDAVLPNALVIAFVKGAKILAERDGIAKLEIDTSANQPGFLVDGQQRLAALSLAEREDFQVFVSCVICKNMDELRRQFILINNTKPLPKSLIYELLPGVDELPNRLTARSLAASITEKLNFDEKSSLYGFIKMQTHPTGLIKDTVLQKAIMNSESAGAIQVLLQQKNGLEKSIELFSNFFSAVQQVFKSDWAGHKPATSRLVHGAGIVALGYVMDELYSRNKSMSIESFKRGLQPLVGKTAWTSGQWKFSKNEVTPWNRIEVTPRQVHQLAEYLVGILRRQ